jgi:TonB family protein
MHSAPVLRETPIELKKGLSLRTFLFVCVLVIFGMVVLSHVLSDDTKTTAKGPEVIPATPEIIPGPVIFHLQQPLRVGYWEYTVHAAHAQQLIQELSELKQADSGQWIVVNLTVCNEDNTSSTRPVIKLVDENKREFSESDVWQNGQLHQLQSLNPGVCKQGNIFFDAPAGFNYLLQVSGGYESGEHALVTLSVPRDDSVAPRALDTPAATAPSEFDQAVARANDSTPRVPPNVSNSSEDEPVYSIGGDVSAPVATYAPDPEYSKEARDAKLQGTCVLSLIVGPDGKPRDVKVTHSLGLGLDEKAIEAVNTWRFEPARKNGTPVAVRLVAKVNYRLYQ